MGTLDTSEKCHQTKIFGFYNFPKYIKMFLLNAIFHIGPLEKNHLKFRQIQIVTMCLVSVFHLLPPQPTSN